MEFGGDFRWVFLFFETGNLFLGQNLVQAKSKLLVQAEIWYLH